MNKLLHYINIPLLTFYLGSLNISFAQTDPEIIRVSIDPETDYTTVDFIGIDNPDVAYYVVKYWGPNSPTNPIAQGVEISESRTNDIGIPGHVYSTTFYLENVTDSAVGFLVTGKDINDNGTGGDSWPPDTSVFLAHSYDSCSTTLQLQWNDYNAWRGQIDNYKLWVIENGANSLVATFPEGVNNTILTNIQPANYLYYIEVEGLGMQVTSNGAAVNALHTPYPEYVYANYGTVNAGNNPEILFTIDPNSGLDSCVLLRSDNPSGPFDSITSLVAQNSQVAYTDEAVDAAQQAYYYTLQVRNNCGNVVSTSSNMAGTIKLTAELNNQAVYLEWNDYQNWPNGVDSYSVQRSFDGTNYNELETTTSLQSTDETYASSAINDFSNQVCYRIIAQSDPNDSLIRGATSTSNIYCFELPGNVHFPFDAFVPGQDGFSTFGPTIEVPPVKFNFKIFNRNGMVVFETDDVNNPRWDGRYQGGDLVPQGVYRYNVVYENPDGKTHTLQGKVTVVRQ